MILHMFSARVFFPQHGRKVLFLFIFFTAGGMFAIQTIFTESFMWPGFSLCVLELKFFILIFYSRKVLIFIFLFMLIVFAYPFIRLAASKFLLFLDRKMIFLANAFPTSGRMSVIASHKF